MGTDISTLQRLRSQDPQRYSAIVQEYRRREKALEQSQNEEDEDDDEDEDDEVEEREEEREEERQEERKKTARKTARKTAMTIMTRQTAMMKRVALLGHMLEAKLKAEPARVKARDRLRNRNVAKGALLIPLRLPTISAICLPDHNREMDRSLVRSRTAVRPNSYRGSQPGPDSE